MFCHRMVGTSLEIFEVELPSPEVAQSAAGTMIALPWLLVL